MNSNCSSLLHMRILKVQVKKEFCYKKKSWPFTVWINCSSDLKFFENSWPSAWNFKSFSPSLEKLFFTVGQNNFGKRILFSLLFRDTLSKKGCRTCKINWKTFCQSRRGRKHKFFLTQRELYSPNLGWDCFATTYSQA